MVVPARLSPYIRHMLDMTLEAFRPYVGQRFALLLPDGGTLPLTLGDAVAAPTDDDPRRARREPFSLIFRPAPDVRLAQGTYRVRAEHDGATTELFLVQIQPDRAGPRLQAIVA